MFLLIIIVKTGLAQQDLSKQIPKETKYVYTDIYDKRYGINMYDKMVIRLKGDSTRRCDGYACSGWVEDFYVNNKLLHKGYYIDGQLKIFKNFYPNGNIEREYKISDDRRSAMNIYYPNGNMKSEIKYIGSDALEWTDFFENGKIEYHELYDKSFEYYITQLSNYENGLPETVLELANKKKLEFTKKEYYSSGRVKIEGILNYNKDMFDYQRNGEWSYYDENGTLKKQEYYIKGELNKTNEF